MKINIVIPCYNEQVVLSKTITTLESLAQKIKYETGVETSYFLSMTEVLTQHGR